MRFTEIRFFSKEVCDSKELYEGIVNFLINSLAPADPEVNIKSKTINNFRTEPPVLNAEYSSRPFIYRTHFVEL